MRITLVRDDLEEEVERQVEVDRDISVQQFLKDEDIPVEEVLVSKNGTIISSRHELEDGDTIRVFDVIAGG
ncbi:MoaD/ThiS family protein [Candidatus Nanohalovita haloferacivicina]|uniref:MoaD/ThiS family protein n=1 Tax=Candidatus Nanohalovita haloferacivicina TaxID=2978046 RepID=UPI003D34ECC8